MKTAIALLIAALLFSALTATAQGLHTVYLPLVIVQKQPDSAPTAYPTALGTPVVAERTPTPQGDTTP